MAHYLGGYRNHIPLGNLPPPPTKDHSTMERYLVMDKKTYPDPQEGQDLLELCLWYMERLFAEFGWYQGIYNSKKLDLSGALAKIITRFSGNTVDDPYIGGVGYKMRDELEAIICSQVDTLEWTHPYGINESIATCYADIAEILQIAREAYRPEDRPYTKPAVVFTPSDHPQYHHYYEGYC